MKKILKIIILIILIEIIPVISYMYITDMKRMKNGEAVIFSNWGYAYSTISNTNSMQVEEIEFTRTYNIIEKLEIEDQTGDYYYYVVNQFQGKRPAIAKINKEYHIDKNKNYEIVFKGYNKLTEYETEQIFENFNIIDINETDKQGLEQVNDEI